MTGTRKAWHAPRRLKAFAFDPTTAKAYANRRLSDVVISLPWDMDPEVTPGPIGEYLEIIDHDPAASAFYEPVDFAAPNFPTDGGLEPAEEDPRFHQQMVYAAIMNTIATFEEALGRPVLWAAEEERQDGRWTTRFVRRLRVYPHGLREANAYYDPQRKALLFGYFEAGPGSTGAIPGTTVFTCLSHDIVVHEATHAILDGRHRYFVEDSHPDMRALHEAFADLVAIFQLFSFPNVLVEQIARTRGDLRSESMLGALAQEFGRTLGRSGALRNALGTRDVEGTWRLLNPNPEALRSATGPHERGAVLVAAVFRSFLNIYTDTTRDLFRIASQGTGILRDGDIDPDLARRLAKQAAEIARRVLRIVIRAMDYVPPVAVSFGAYLRAIMTADHDLFPEDNECYRTAILEAFAAWGIVPEDMPIVTESTLLWPTFADSVASEERRAERVMTALHSSVGGRLKMPEFKTDGMVSLDAVEGYLAAMVRDPARVYREFSASLLGGEAEGVGASPRDNKARQKIIARLETEVAADEERLAGADPGKAARATLEGELAAKRERLRKYRYIDDAYAERGAIARRVNEEIARINRQRKRATTKIEAVDLERVGAQNVLERGGVELGQSLDRETEFLSREHFAKLIWMMINTSATPELSRVLGLMTDGDDLASVRRSSITGTPSLHVLPVRRARRIGQRGTIEDEYVVEVVQTRYGFFDPKRQARADGDAGFAETAHDFLYRAGCTLVVNARSFEIRRLIRTPHRVDEEAGLEALRRHLSDQPPQDDFAARRASEPAAAFAQLHRRVRGTEDAP